MATKSEPAKPRSGKFKIIGMSDLGCKPDISNEELRNLIFTKGFTNFVLSPDLTERCSQMGGNDRNYAYDYSKSKLDKYERTFVAYKGGAFCGQGKNKYVLDVKLWEVWKDWSERQKISIFEVDDYSAHVLYDIIRGEDLDGL